MITSMFCSNKLLKNETSIKIYFFVVVDYGFLVLKKPGIVI